MHSLTLHLTEYGVCIQEILLKLNCRNLHVEATWPRRTKIWSLHYLYGFRQAISLFLSLGFLMFKMEIMIPPWWGVVNMYRWPGKLVQSKFRRSAPIYSKTGFYLSNCCVGL